ncbi:manganese efflux pump MntP family protein [Desmospora activa]|uniref:Putative manganese efflux pump MntP n=1 Tax=Desmospora activa DSM 45169 TaxID=1121389 RepID=A0A2T4Z4F3_9BACL|nr:manganese efflux pump [Desmospora activa]PTM56767.1 putative Mn2+ efflux pump MntP [Desmospora activa DSM 45169]
MEWALPQWGQLITLFIIATAMGMDAFSLGLGMGMRGILLRQVMLTSVSVGFFHMFMPMVGIAIGRILGVLVEQIAVMIGGGLLIFLGINMVYQAWGKSRANTSNNTANVSSIWGVLLFSLSVSLDSLSAGFSLGLFEVDTILAVLLFGWISMLMAGTGLLLGRHVSTWIGGYGEAVGGMILIGLGLRFLV